MSRLPDTTTMGADGMPSRWAVVERRAPWIAALLALVAALLTMTSDPIGVFNDDGIYLLTAKALAEGQGYVYPHLPGTPPAIHYPPVWPLLLAAMLKVAPAFPASISWLKLINPFVLAAAAAATAHVGRTRFGLPWWMALGVAVAATVSVPMLLLTNLLLSEPLFIALLLPTLVVVERLVREGGVRMAVIAALLVALLVLVRTLGGVVLIAGVMLLVWERRWKELLVFGTLTVLLLLPWQMFVWRASPTFPDELRGSYGPYLEWVVGGYKDSGLPFLKAVLAKNFDATWRMIGVLTSPTTDGPWRHVSATLALAMFAAGMVALARRGRAPVTVLALGGYLFVVVVWPFWVDRFLWVVWPLLLLIALAGVVAMWRAAMAMERRSLAHAVTAVTVLVAAGHTSYSYRGLSRGWEASASKNMTSAAVPMVRWINLDASLDGKLIAAELAPLVAIYTGLDVLPVEILTPQEHVRDKTAADHQDELERIDRRFRPDAYVVMQAGPFYQPLLAAQLGEGRRLVDVSPPGLPVRTLKVQTP